jgi:hypothetical protein
MYLLNMQANYIKLLAQTADLRGEVARSVSDRLKSMGRLNRERIGYTKLS